METKMVIETFGSSMSTVEEGAEATVRLATSPELEGVTGRYFDGTREGRADAQAYDEGAKKRLWNLSEELCGTLLEPLRAGDRKSTRLNSSHANISYAVFCLKKKKGNHTIILSMITA